MYQTMLVAVDIAGCAHEVVAAAAPLAQGLGATVHLVYATHLPTGVHVDDVVRTSVHPEGQGALAALDEDARAHLEQLADVFRDLQVPVHVCVHHGAPVEAVLRAADKHAADMIVLGTHGRKGVKRLLVGSVAEQILRRARVPVTVVRSLALDSHPGLTPVQAQLLAENDG